MVCLLDTQVMAVLKIFQSYSEKLHTYKENTWVWPYEILSPELSEYAVEKASGFLHSLW